MLNSTFIACTDGLSEDTSSIALIGVMLPPSEFFESLTDTDFLAENRKIQQYGVMRLFCR